MIPNKFVSTSGIPEEGDATYAGLSANAGPLAYLMPLLILPGGYNSDVWPVIADPASWTLLQIGGTTGSASTVLAGGA